MNFLIPRKDGCRFAPLSVDRPVAATHADRPRSMRRLRLPPDRRRVAFARELVEEQPDQRIGRSPVRRDAPSEAAAQRLPDQLQVVSRQNVRIRPPGGGAGRDQAVVVALLLGYLAGERRERLGEFLDRAAAEQGPVGDVRAIGHGPVELARAVAGEIAQGAAVEQAQERRGPGTRAQGPLGRGRAAVRRSDGDHGADAAARVEPAREVARIEAAHAVAHQNQARLGQPAEQAGEARRPLGHAAGARQARQDHVGADAGECSAHRL